MQRWLRIFSTFIGTISLVCLTACSNFGFPGVYRIEIQQGNIIEQDEVSQLKPGMTKSQVIFVMGSPMITDTFHQSRWDYTYSLRDGDGVTTQKHLMLSFKGDLLESINEVAGDFDKKSEIETEAKSSKTKQTKAAKADNS